MFHVSRQYNIPLSTGICTGLYYSKYIIIIIAVHFTPVFLDPRVGMRRHNIRPCSSESGFVQSLK